MFIPTTTLTQGIGGWQDYTPTFTASVGNPTLGVGGTILGRYVQIGTTVVVKTRIIFGSSGESAGSGTYRVTLPITPDDEAWASPVIGMWFLFDSNAGLGRVASAQFDSTAGALIAFVDSATTNMTAASPWTWAANDQLHFNVAYEQD